MKGKELVSDNSTPCGVKEDIDKQIKHFIHEKKLIESTIFNLQIESGNLLYGIYQT